MNLKITVTIDSSKGIESLQRHYRIGLTKAPKVYDYGSTLQIAANLYGPEYDKTRVNDWRIVAIPIAPTNDGFSDSQIPRYSSGLYPFLDSDNPEFDEYYPDAEGIVNLIYKKLYSAKEED